MQIVKQYAAQPSTWRGLAILLSLFGLPAIDPDLLTQVGIGIAGAIGVYETVKNRA